MGNLPNPSGNSRQNQNSADKLQIIRNFEETFDSMPARRKPTREELLNGTSSEIALNGKADPRFKSPDDLLKKLAPKKQLAPDPVSIEPVAKEVQKPAPKREPLNKEVLKKDTPDLQPIAEVQPTNTEFQPHYGMPDIAQIRQELDNERKNKIVEINHTPMPDVSDDGSEDSFFPGEATEKEKLLKEISQWKDYSQQVKMWQSQVMGIVKNLKDELKKKQDKSPEFMALKDQIRLKDAEIARLKKQQKGSLLGWMKGFVRAGT